MPGIFGNLKAFYNTYFSWIRTSSVTVAGMTVTDILEIVILSFLVYHVMIWIRATRAWTLLKGILIMVIFVAMAYLFQMDTITFLINKGIDLAVMAAIIVFQPELRRALEQLGEKKFFSSLGVFDSTKEVKERFSDKTINELVRASFEMGEVKTGALIVIEKTITLEEYEKTGIPIDGVLTSQLLINIFEHNTPLHDGAVIVRNNRVTAATCYLPLSDNMDLNKNLGTRHRAGVGISEVTDSFTIIVSEETGNVSYASGGELHTAVTPSDLREQLHKIQKLAKKPEEKKGWHIRGMRQKVEGEKK